MQPQNCAAHFRRAKAYAALGKHDKAEEDYIKYASRVRERV